MAAIRESTEIARRPEEVFAYLDDLARHGEWQDNVVDVRVDTAGPTTEASSAPGSRREARRSAAGGPERAPVARERRSVPARPARVPAETRADVRPDGDRLHRQKTCRHVLPARARSLPARRESGQLHEP